MTDDIKKNAKEVADKIHDAADKASEKFTQGIHYGRERAQDAADRFQDGFDDLGDFSRDKAREIRDEFLGALDEEKCGCSAALFTRERPLFALAIAALIGFVLGRVIRRRG